MNFNLLCKFAVLNDEMILFVSLKLVVVVMSLDELYTSAQHILAFFFSQNHFFSFLWLSLCVAEHFGEHSIQRNAHKINGFHLISAYASSSSKRY